MEQYDDHCKLCAAGKIWHITAIQLERIGVRRIVGWHIIDEVIDTSKVDWGIYCKAAVEIINRRYRQ